MVGEHDHIVRIWNGDGYGGGTPAFDVTNSPWGPLKFRTEPGDNMGEETRPVNKAVRWLIKAE